MTLASLHRLFDGPEAALDEVVRQLLERRTHHRHDQVLRARGVGRDERQVDLGLGDRGELDLRLLRGLEQPLERLGILAQVDALVALELVGEVVDETSVEVVTAEVGVPRGGPDLDDPLADVEDADVERPAAEVEDQDRLVLDAGRGRRRARRRSVR